MNNNDNNINNSNSIINEIPTVKRKRGRPKKIQIQNNPNIKITKEPKKIIVSFN
jgi:hypothetical protein